MRNGGGWSQQAYLKASNTDKGDVFGFSVAISGDTVVVGAPGEDSDAIGVNGNQNNNSFTNAGAAYVFVRNGTTWRQHVYLKASNTGPPASVYGLNDEFGRSVAVSGDTVVVGTEYEDSAATGINGDDSNDGAQNSGAAYIFTVEDSSPRPFPSPRPRRVAVISPCPPQPAQPPTTAVFANYAWRWSAVPTSSGGTSPATPGAIPFSLSTTP